MSTSGPRSLGGSAPGMAGPGLGLSLLQRDREDRRSAEEGGEGMERMRLGE
jgi:hypothetical protein